MRTMTARQLTAHVACICRACKTDIAAGMTYVHVDPSIANLCMPCWERQSGEAAAAGHPIPLTVGPQIGRKAGVRG